MDDYELGQRYPALYECLLIVSQDNDMPFNHNIVVELLVPTKEDWSYWRGEGPAPTTFDLVALDLEAGKLKTEEEREAFCVGDQHEMEILCSDLVLYTLDYFLNTTFEGSLYAVIFNRK